MGWRHDQVAHLVGLIVMRAAEAEHMLSLLASVGQKKGSSKGNPFGRSGKKLSNHLAQIAASSPAVADILERYNAWSMHRNQLVHSIRPVGLGMPGSETALPIISKQKDLPPRELYNVQKQDLPELVDLWYGL